nr:hypothetical protein [Cellvibrionaceae bacterium]
PCEGRCARVNHNQSANNVTKRMGPAEGLEATTQMMVNGVFVGVSAGTYSVTTAGAFLNIVPVGLSEETVKSAT